MHSHTRFTWNYLAVYARACVYVCAIKLSTVNPAVIQYARQTPNISLSPLNKTPYLYLRI